MSDSSATYGLHTSTEGEESFHDTAGDPVTFIKPLRMAADLKGLAKYASGDVRGNLAARMALNMCSSESEGGAGADSSCCASPSYNSSNLSLAVHCSDETSVLSSETSFVAEAVEKKEREREEEAGRETTPHRRKEPSRKRSPKRRWAEVSPESRPPKVKRPRVETPIRRKKKKRITTNLRQLTKTLNEGA